MSRVDAYALAGLTAASARLSIRAQNIANMDTEGYRPVTPVQTSEAGGPVVRSVDSPAQGNGTGVEGDIVDTIETTIAYKANAKVLKTGEELDKALLDILA